MKEQEAKPQKKKHATETAACAETVTPPPADAAPAAESKESEPTVDADSSGGVHGHSGSNFSDVPRTLLRKFETCDISSDTNGTNGSQRFLAPHRYVLRAFEARPRRPTSLLPGVVRRRGDPRIRLGCDFRPDDHAKPKLGVGVALHIVERRVTRLSSGKVITGHLPGNYP